LILRTALPFELVSVFLEPPPLFGLEFPFFSFFPKKKQLVRSGENVLFHSVSL